MNIKDTCRHPLASAGPGEQHRPHCSARLQHPLVNAETGGRSCQAGPEHLHVCADLRLAVGPAGEFV